MRWKRFFSPGSAPSAESHAQGISCSVVHAGHCSAVRGLHNGLLCAWQAYAMTEASHQMTSNPLPHRGPHKPGTVGRAQGSVKVRQVMDIHQINDSKWHRLCMALFLGQPSCTACQSSAPRCCEVRQALPSVAISLPLAC